MCKNLGRYKHVGSKLKLNARRQTEELISRTTLENIEWAYHLTFTKHSTTTTSIFNESVHLF